MDPIVVRISGLVSASVGNACIVVPSADYYAEELPGVNVDTWCDGFEASNVAHLPVWKLRAVQPQRVPADVQEFDLTDEELSRYVVGGEITILEEMCP